MKNYFFLSLVCVKADAASFLISAFDKVLGAFIPFEANLAIPGDVFSFLAINPPFEGIYKKRAREQEISAPGTINHIAPTATNSAMVARSITSLDQNGPRFLTNLVGPLPHGADVG